MIRKPGSTGALSAVFAAFLIFSTFVVSPATAGSAAREDSPEPTTPAARLSPEQASSEAEANAAVQYWTPERMASAKPMNMRSLPDQDGNIARRPPAPATVAHGFLDGKAPSGVAPSVGPASEGYWQGSYSAAPAKSIGKLFFQTWIPSQRKYGDSVCSATVIAAENRSTVWTAGHCIYQTYSNIWNRDFLFCPGYRKDNGVPGEAEDCPLGKWTERFHAATEQWLKAVCSPSGLCKRTEYNYDLGALAVEQQDDDQTIEARVGSHVLRYNTRVTRHYVFGYPQNSPFTGRYLYACIATNVFDHGHLRQVCRMTAGASGGPWLSNFNSGWRGYLNSVNSHVEGGSGRMDGPFQGAVAQQLYNYIRNK
jgi:V8-like Glu-specific endopeptidase